MDRQALYEKIIQLNWQQQLGNLASSFATISNMASISQQDTLTLQLLREVALIIEWCAKNVPESYHWELAAIQRECLNWYQIFPLDPARQLLALNTRHYSERILNMAGLLEVDSSLKENRINKLCKN